MTMPVSTLLLLLTSTAEQGHRQNCEQEGKVTWGLRNESGTNNLIHLPAVSIFEKQAERGSTLPCSRGRAWNTLWGPALPGDYWTPRLQSQATLHGL